MPLELAYIDTGGAGLGVLAVFGALTFLGVAISTIYLIVPKDSIRRCEDAKLAAIIAGCLGDLIPALVIVELVRRGLGDRFDVMVAAVCATAVALNSALAAAAFVQGRRQQARLKANGFPVSDGGPTRGA